MTIGGFVGSIVRVDLRQACKVDKDVIRREGVMSNEISNIHSSSIFDIHEICSFWLLTSMVTFRDMPVQKEGLS